MNLQLNDTNNLNQNVDAPIKLIVKFDDNKHIQLEAFWFNKFSSAGQGAWEELAFIDRSNGKIIISVNHTSIFAITGKIKFFPLFGRQVQGLFAG